MTDETVTDRKTCENVHDHVWVQAESDVGPTGLPTCENCGTTWTGEDLSPLNETAIVIRDIEAYRSATKQPELEETLSLMDWVNQRIAPAVKQAAQMAKYATPATQYEAWIEAAALIVGRAEQVLIFQTRQECEHDFPYMHAPEGESTTSSLDLEQTCDRCGLALVDLLAAQERNEMADELEELDRKAEELRLADEEKAKELPQAGGCSCGGSCGCN